MVALKASFVALSLLGLAAAKPGGYGGGGGDSGYGGSGYGGSGYGGSGYGGSGSSYDNSYSPPKNNYDNGGYSAPPQDNSYNSYSSSSSSYEYSSSMTMESSSSYMPPPEETSMMTESSSTYMPPPEETSMMMESSSSYYMPPPEETSMMMESSSMYMPPPSETTEYSPPPSYTTSEYMSMPSYGSGSNYWGNSGYNDCVQQCMASYAPPPSMYTPPPMSDDDKKGMGSSGKMWNVVVAPKKGVFRMVPFALNAQPGDTVRFMWGADGHTVTQGSELKICNKTDASGAFDTQKQNQGFTFEQVVKDSNPIFFFCAVATHCEQGMFGIVNPPSAPGSQTSVDMMMQNTYMKDESMAPMISSVMNACKDNEKAASWGKDFDMASVPQESRAEFFTNVMLTRYTMAKNGDLVDGNNFNPTTPMSFEDITSLAANASAPANPQAPANAGSGSSTSSDASAPSQDKKSGASRSITVSSSGVAIILAAAVLLF